MKKFLFSLAAVAAISLSANAQTRMTLHEEFTGENCPPCASTNPGFWSLCNATGNPAKLTHISYMVPIPSAGWYCNRTTAIYTARDAYYSVPFAPYGRYDGHVPNPTASSPGHPGFFTQADIDAEALVPSQFNMTVANAWSTNFDTIITTVNVTCVTAYTGSLYLRTALIHTDIFATPPGSNGESHFENVVQAMYPNALGTSMTSTWAPGDVMTYTIKGAVPSWVDKTDAPYMVAWIQNDADKYIAQAGVAASLPPVALDAASVKSTVPSTIVCATGTYSSVHSVVLKNTGTTALTSAKIYYSIDGGAMTAYSWTGSLAASSTISVAMPAASMAITTPAYHTFKDSVAMPNGVADVNPVNNVTATSIFIEPTTGLALPYTTSFEGTDYAQHYISDASGNGATWGIWYNTTTPLGHTGATAAKYNNYPATVGVGNVLTLPVLTTGAKANLDFWVADCQVTATDNDKLEVVYSSDCGVNWTSVWSLSGSALATTAPSNTYFTPTSASQYVKHSTALTGLPVGSMIAFRATSGHGQNLWLDDINITAIVGVNDVVASSENISVYPNPAQNEATLSFHLSDNSDVQVQIVDGLGRVVSTVANEKMDVGVHTYTLNTSSLATGIYNVMIKTEGGTNTQRLTITK